MQKFECPGCGGRLKENGRFWICENCGTRYALGKDDEGNPFTYLPLEKKEITHGQTATKSTTIEVNKITVKEIKLSNTIDSDVQNEILHIDSTERIGVIESYLKLKEWDAAQAQINDLLREDHESAEAQWFGLMCERKASNDRDMLKSFSNMSIADQQRLDRILSASNPLFAKRIINLMFSGAYFNDSMCLSTISTVLPYAKNGSVYREKEYNEWTLYVFEKVIQNHFSRTFDYLLSSALNENEVDRYIAYIERYADSSQTFPNEAQEYYARILVVDPGNIKIHRKLINADLQADTSYNKCISDFENLLQYASDTDKEAYAVISNIIAFNPTTINKSEFLWQALGYHSEAPEGFKFEIKKYSKVLLSSKLWEQADRFLKLVLSFDARDAETYFLLCLVRLKARKESEIALKNENLIECREFAKSISLYQKSSNPVDKARANELLALTKKQKSSKKVKKVGIFIIIAVVAVALGVFAIKGIIKLSEIRENNKIMAYNKAIELLNKEQWAEAYKAFSDLGNYKDSKEHFEVAKEKVDQENRIKEETQKNYTSAIILYESGDYENALKAFQDMVGYEDSESYISKCKDGIVEKEYSKAIELYENREYENALSVFESLGSYKNSSSMVSSCKEKIADNKYSAAVELMENKKYKDAITVFESLGGYKDSKEKIKKCNEAILEINYLMALDYFNQNKFNEAISEFEKLDGYKDSKEKINECRNILTEEKYQRALNYYSHSQFDDALELFRDLNQYKDSQTYINHIDIMQSNIGDVVKFGVYEQDNDLENGMEAIEWVVVDKKDEIILVLSKQVLEWMKYSETYNWKDTAWDNCAIRKWLNNDFFNTAFSDVEKNQIVLTDVELDEYTYGDKYSKPAGSATKDYLFLFGMKDYETYCITEVGYGYVKGNEISNGYRTEYALQKANALVESYWRTNNYYCEWWLRYRSEQYDNCVSAAYYDGGTINEAAQRYLGVRPAMWISISK